MNKIIALTASALVVSLAIATGFAQPAKALKKSTAGKNKNSNLIPLKHFFTDVRKSYDISGRCQADSAKKISLDTKQLRNAKIQKTVAFGSKVKKGDTLIWIDTKDLEKTLANAEKKYLTEKYRQEAKILAQKNRDMSLVSKTESLKRGRIAIERDWKYYLEHGHKDKLEAIENRKRVAKYRLDYAKSEYEQLKKMYEQDQLKEETEAVIMLRQKIAYENAKREYKRQMRQLELKEKFEAPLWMQEEKQRYLQRVRDSKAAELKHKIAVLDNHGKLKKLEEKLAKIESDYKILKKEILETKEIKSPISGIVYFGNVTQSAPNFNRSKNSVKAGTVIAKGAVVMTVLSPGRIKIPVTFDREKRKLATVGQAGSAVANDYPDIKLTAKIIEVSNFMTSPNRYSGMIAITCNAGPVMPGTNIRVKLKHEKKNCLVLPRDYIKSDPQSPASYYICVRKNGKTKKVPVTLGAKINKNDIKADYAVEKNKAKNLFEIENVVDAAGVIIK